MNQVYHYHFSIQTTQKVVSGMIKTDYAVMYGENYTELLNQIQEQLSVETGFCITSLSLLYIEDILE